MMNVHKLNYTVLLSTMLQPIIHIKRQRGAQLAERGAAAALALAASNARALQAATTIAAYDPAQTL